MTNEETSYHGKKEGSIDVVDLLVKLWDERRFILMFAGIATAVAIVVSLLMPNYYKSTVILLTEIETSKLASLGGFADLAAIAGVGGGEGSLVKLYPIIIKSESVLRNVLYTRYHSTEFKDSVDLIQFWGIKTKTPELTYETGLGSLRDGLTVSIEPKTSVITLSIETKEPQLSADIVNAVTVELDRFIRTKKTTNATEQRKWIEARLVEVKSDLEKSENTLREFREKNRRVVDSPQLLLEQERLIREVQINSTIYTELKRQYELIKIEEIKNIPIINVLDEGRAAAKKESPKRSIIIATTLFLSLMLSGAYVLLKNQYGEMIRRFLARVVDYVKRRPSGRTQISS